jgi:hypothetical protein
LGFANQIKTSQNPQTRKICAFTHLRNQPIVAVRATNGNRALARKQNFDIRVDGTVNELFAALVTTIAFRRWATVTASAFGQPPVAGYSYRYRAGSVLRQGRVVEVIRPVAVTLKEVLHDPPCRVALTLRWRVDSASSGCSVRLRAEYRLNHAAVLRTRHWDRRLAAHFRRQFTFLTKRLEASRGMEVSMQESAAKRDLIQH